MHRWRHCCCSVAPPRPEREISPCARVVPSDVVLTTSGVCVDDAKTPMAFESPRRAHVGDHSARPAHPVQRSLAFGPAAVGPKGSAPQSGMLPVWSPAFLRPGGQRDIGCPCVCMCAHAAASKQEDVPSSPQRVPAAALLHPVSLVADWRVNASLCTYFLPLLPPEHLLHALRRRARHAMRTADRLALAGCLNTARLRLPSMLYRKLRLSCLDDATRRLAKLVSRLSPLRPVSVLDLLRTPPSPHTFASLAAPPMAERRLRKVAFAVEPVGGAQGAVWGCCHR